MRIMYNTVRGGRSEDAETALLSLEVDSSPLLFPEGRLRLRCLATQFTMYRRSTDLQVVEDTPQLAPVLGPTAHHQGAPCITKSKLFL